MKKSLLITAIALALGSNFALAQAVTNNDTGANVGLGDISKPSFVKPKTKDGKLVYPAAPSSYLRDNATPEQRREALDTMRRQTSGTAATGNAVPRPNVADFKAPVNQVALNTSNIVSVKPGDNVYIPISREHPNRLLTPFKDPQIISTSLTGGRGNDCGEVCIRDDVIYITTDTTAPVTAFITEKGHEDIAFSVTMMPQAMPPREVRFKLPDDVVDQLRTKTGTHSNRRAEAWETAQPYVDTIRLAMRSIALGNVPNGYSLRKVLASDPVPYCKHPGLAIDFRKGQLMEGFNLDFYVGVLTNVADNAVEFREQNCGGWRIAAVTSWPLKVLKPGQQTEVYIAVKHQDEVDVESVRKPLIERQYN